jgi:hypothetical protein
MWLNATTQRASFATLPASNQCEHGFQNHDMSIGPRGAIDAMEKKVDWK